MTHRELFKDTLNRTILLPVFFMLFVLFIIVIIDESKYSTSVFMGRILGQFFAMVGILPPQFILGMIVILVYVVFIVVATVVFTVVYGHLATVLRLLYHRLRGTSPKSIKSEKR